MLRRLLPLLPPLLLLTACAAASDRGDERIIRVLDPPIVVGEMFASRPADLDAGHFTLMHPTDLRVQGDTVIVVDNGSDRIVLFDPALQPLGDFGRSGFGPGELEAPLYVQVWNDQYVVGEGNSQRLSFFDRNGEFVRMLRLPGSLGFFDFGDDGTLYIASRDPEHYLTAISPDGNVRRFARRPDGIYGPEDRDEYGLPRSAGWELVAVTDGGRIHVVDNHLGLLLRYDTAGDLQLMKELPPELLQPLRKERDEFVGAFVKRGVRVLAAPLMKGLTVNPDGSLFLLFRVDDVAGAVLDPVDYSSRLVQMPPNPVHEKLVLNASAAVIRGDTLYAVADFGLHAFHLRVP